MKEIAQSMTPEQAATAFFGQDDAEFAKTMALLTRNDPRLEQVFRNTRNRFLEDRN